MCNTPRIKIEKSRRWDKIQGIERKMPEGYVALVMEILVPWGDQNIEEERK